MDYQQTFVVNHFGLRLDKLLNVDLNSERRKVTSNFIKEKEICFVHFPGPKEPMKLFLDSLKDHGLSFSLKFDQWIRDNRKYFIRDIFQNFWSDLSKFTYPNLDQDKTKNSKILAPFSNSVSSNISIVEFSHSVKNTVFNGEKFIEFLNNYSSMGFEVFIFGSTMFVFGFYLVFQKLCTFSKNRKDVVRNLE